MEVRVLEPQDVDQLASLFEHLSLQSRYLRFMAPIPTVSATVINHLADVDHQRHEAVGMFDGDVLVGSAHYFRSADQPSTAEISIEIADEHQQRGLGGCLLKVLSDLARERGITEFTATALRENRAVRALLRGSGWPITSRLSGPESTMVITLPAPRPAPVVSSCGCVATVLVSPLQAA